MSKNAWRFTTMPTPSVANARKAELARAKAAAIRAAKKDKKKEDKK